jgi:hypothetical protein
LPLYFFETMARFRHIIFGSSPFKQIQIWARVCLKLFAVGNSITLAPHSIDFDRLRKGKWPSGIGSAAFVLTNFVLLLLFYKLSSGKLCSSICT